MRCVYISKYPNPETEVAPPDVWIECKFEDLKNAISVACRMRPDRIVIEYESFLDNEDDEDDE